MTYLSLSILGILSFTQISISLLPDIDIPEVSIHIQYPNKSAREIEQVVVSPINSKLAQLANVDRVVAKIEDGFATINYRFFHGVDLDYALIEINEKLDALLSELPPDIPRPIIVRDIPENFPVFFLNVSFKQDKELINTPQVSWERQIELSDFAEKILKRRIEQLPEISSVDLSGIIQPVIDITLNTRIMKVLGISELEVQRVIQSYNNDGQSLTVKEGPYRYQLKYTNPIRLVEDLRSIQFKHAEKIIALEEVADISVVPGNAYGLYFTGNQIGVTLALIKHPKSRMDDLENNLQEVLEDIVLLYPEIQLDISHNQAVYLKQSVNNLTSSLVIGIFLAMVVLYLFIADIGGSLLIGITIPIALVISMFFFNFLGISINIISLSGLILSTGMMIDNSIIVIENVKHYLEQGLSRLDATAKGTTEVVTPLLSSTFSTISVFLPTIFLSEIAGAIFWDQALVISFSLLISYCISISFLPTYYKLFAFRSRITPNFIDHFIKRTHHYTLHWAIKYPRIILIIAALIVLGGAGIFPRLTKELFPPENHTDFIITLDWNEDITLEENYHRVKSIVQELLPNVEQCNGFIGRDQFQFERFPKLEVSQARIYIQPKPGRVIKQEVLKVGILKAYPLANLQFSDPLNVFRRIFDTSAPSLVAEVYFDEKVEGGSLYFLKQLDNFTLPNLYHNIATKRAIYIKVNHQNLLRYGVDYNDLILKLQTLLGNFMVGELTSFQNLTPILLKGRPTTLNELIRSATIYNNLQLEIPIGQLIDLEIRNEVKPIYLSKVGEYFPISFFIENGEKESTIEQLHSIFSQDNVEIMFSGKVVKYEEYFSELILALAVSTILLYFILAIQFESLLQPLLVLIELPISISGSILLLYISNSSLNIMSLIGIIVVCGIVVNDSILKIDTINRLRREQYPLWESIRLGSLKRLRPILITSITTIAALIPISFASGLGANLQIPLSISIIGGLAVGTLVSIYLIPVLYKIINNEKQI